ncbi:MAG TPA: hypothetical protein VNU25_01890 [Candidatus Paceibacterota bacterium]|nr:hypothetical protein [Candidatus Paceibacterota bacterium]
MATVSFEEEQQLASAPIASRAPKGIVGMLIRSKLAKDEKSANTTMLIIVAVCIVAAVGLFVLAGGETHELTNQERLRLERSTPPPMR